MGDGALCAAYAGGSAAHAALLYNEASARLVLGLKYGDRTRLARVMAMLMLRAVGEAHADAPLVVPVPLHPRRIRQRFFNQAALIASALARLTKAEACPGALERTRDTPPSRGMSRSARHANVRGAMRVAPAARAAIAGRRVLVVDDVMTTGATVETCARLLKLAGAARVDIVTFACVTHDDKHDI